MFYPYNKKTNYSIEKSTKQTTKTLPEYLVAKGILINIEEGKWQIDVEKLMESKQSVGKGDATSELKDVYMFEKSSGTGYILNKKIANMEITPPSTPSTSSGSTTYIVKYYGEKGTEERLGNIVDGNYGSDSTDSDIAKLQEYFSKGPNEFWNNSTGRYNDIEPIIIENSLFQQIFERKNGKKNLIAV